MMESTEIIKKANNKTEAAKKVYAYGTNVTPEKSLQEIRHILNKFKAIGYQYTELPTGFRCIRFYLPDPELKQVPIQIEIPKLYIITKNGKEYLERESWRIVVEQLKAKLYALSDNETRPLKHFLDCVLLKNGLTAGNINDQNLFLPAKNDGSS